MGLGKPAGFDQQRKGRRVSQKPEHEGQRSGSQKKGGSCETGTLGIQLELRVRTPCV